MKLLHHEPVIKSQYVQIELSECMPTGQQIETRKLTDRMNCLSLLQTLIELTCIHFNFHSFTFQYSLNECDGLVLGCQTHFRAVR